MYLSDKIIETIKENLFKQCGESCKDRIGRCVTKLAFFWEEKDGDEHKFADFCQENFISDNNLLDKTYQRLELNFEAIYGNYHKMRLELNRPLALDWGEILPIDRLFGTFSPSSHLTDDLFANGVAFFIILNFPHYSLEEKISLGKNWTRKQWGYARMGDMFSSRIPSELSQKTSRAFTEADTYINEYNLFMNTLLDANGNKLYNKPLKLISHWGLRDELRARHTDSDGLAKQKMIYSAMKRIINQEIPQKAINTTNYQWNPFTNQVFQKGKKVDCPSEPDTRYQHILNIFHVVKEQDKFYPGQSTFIKRRFENGRELTEQQVEKLFVDFISSPIMKKVAKLLEERLGRKLEPFDIWYQGFKGGTNLNQEKLDEMVKEQYPDIKTFQDDIPNILIKLGFDDEKSKSIGEKIVVDPARGAGHASGAAMRSDISHLRTRVPKEGMNYKGFNIGMHELGHCVEQVITLQDIDYYMLEGVPNTAFTEAFAFVFQGKDMDMLGIDSKNKNTHHLKALYTLWASYEIMGVALVDMKMWNWLYDNPKATAQELKYAVISIAKEIWNTYYADVIGMKDEPILAIYSHMVDGGLYLPDYPIGHIIEFQISQYLKDKIIGEEMYRMCLQGRITPQLWMKFAVGSKISTEPLLKAAEEALEELIGN